MSALLLLFHYSSPINNYIGIIGLVISIITLFLSIVAIRVSVKSDKFKLIRVSANSAPESVPESTPESQSVDAVLAAPKKVYIPYPRNVYFTGRYSLLSEMRAALASDRMSTLPSVVALIGLGGIGKTQLALEYSYRYQNEYDIVWWIRSDENTTIIQDYAQITKSFDLLAKDARDLNQQARAAKSFLEGRSKWLLVFDNVKFSQDIEPYLPCKGGGHVIITSRNRYWENITHFLTAIRFDRNESIEFLSKITGQSNREAASELAEVLGDLPLALSQAGAYIKETSISIGIYLEQFLKMRDELLMFAKPDAYPGHIATTLKISVIAAGRDAPMCVDLLNLCAYLAPDLIPKALLLKGADYLPQPLDSTAKNEIELDKILGFFRTLLPHKLLWRGLFYSRNSASCYPRWT